VKRLALGVVAALVLSGCNLITKYEPYAAPIIAGDATVTVVSAVSTPESGPLYEVAFAPGELAAESVVLGITAGENASLRVNDEKCAFILEGGQNLGLKCILGTVPGGQAYKLTVRATSKPDALVTFFRPGSQIPRYVRTLP
jgi:hypothetical protein